VVQGERLRGSKDKPNIHMSSTTLLVLRSYPAAEMEAVPANPVMNKPTVEGPECLILPS